MQFINGKKNVLNRMYIILHNRDYIFHLKIKEFLLERGITIKFNIQKFHLPVRIICRLATSINGNFQGTNYR